MKIPRGRLEPVSGHLLAEPVIIARMAEAIFGPEHVVDGQTMAEGYDVICDHASRVVEGTEDFNRRTPDADHGTAEASASQVAKTAP